MVHAIIELFAAVQVAVKRRREWQFFSISISRSNMEEVPETTARRVRGGDGEGGGFYSRV